MKCLKKMILTSIIYSFCGIAFSQTIVEQHGKLHIEGTKIMDQYGQQVQLKGMCFFHHIYLNSYKYQNEKCMKWLRDDWKIQMVRTAIVADRGNTGLAYFEKPEFSLDVARKAIKAAVKAGLYIIIDWHQHKIYDEAQDFFSILASEFPDVPNIIWEIHNEPIKQPWAQIKSNAEKIIATIRQHSKDNIIVVGTPMWCSQPDVASEDPIIADSKGNPVKNIAYTLHFYAGTHKENIINRATKAVNNGLCLFVTECGSVKANGDGVDDIESWNKWVNWMDANQVSWCKWSLSTKEEGASCLTPSADFNGNWNIEKDLTNSGIWMRNYFREIYKKSDNE